MPGMADVPWNINGSREKSMHGAGLEENTVMNEHLDKIAAFLKDKSRLSFTGQKRTVLRQRLAARIELLQLPDFPAYWEWLQHNPDEELHLFELATTNETSFFRNAVQFAYLKEKIIPSLEFRAVRENSSFRILSAGCSTGEEPYSIAMTLRDALSNRENISAQIVAGDISENCLRIARDGYYDENKLAKLPGDYKKRFMTETDGGARVNADIRELVRFSRLNLDDLMNADSPSWNQGMGLFEIIFCRNVMIYFSPACQQQLIDTLYRLLKPGGYLFTGDAEPLHLFSHEFKPVAEADCLIYQKKERSINDNTF